MIPLKVMTDYSLLQSMITIPHLMETLKAKNIAICGICDTNLFGVMEFYDACLSNQIKPIIGLEIKIDELNLYLYAKNYRGYQGLLKIHTLNETKALTLFDILKWEKELIVVLPYDEITKFSLLNTDILDLWIGVSSDYERNNALIVTDKVVLLPNIKVIQKRDTEYLRLLISIQNNESLTLIPKTDFEKNSFEYYENEVDPKWDMFINLIHIEIPKNKRYIPHYDEKNIDSFKYLESLSQKGLKKRCKGIVPINYQDRLNYELSVIHKMGFADYFLIVYDYVFYAKKNQILVGAGRGSAVGSLVSYSLGITDIDPLKYNLLFERFLNPERVTMPDIDIDFEEDKRDEVVNYVKKRYGEKNVAGIMTFGTLKSKLVLRSVGKSLEMNANVLDHFLKFIDPKLSLKDNLANKEVSYYVQHNEEIKRLVEDSLKIEGLKKNISTHAAGVVISSTPLDNVIPIYYNGTDLITGTTMNYLEELGLLKMDFLALRNLTMIHNVLELIKENTGEELNLNKIDLRDEKIITLFQKADTDGIFQFESAGIKNVLRKMKPTSFLDLVSVLAMFRPGPMGNIDTFIKRKHGEEKITYLHSDLEPILKETYGVIVYQEQVMQILVIIGGFTLGEADIIRRAMSKKKKELILSYEEQFVNGAIKKGYGISLAKQIYALILKFANYGFNKSHSVSYAFIGYQMAYLKVYYPMYFLTNLLNMNMDSIDKTKEYLLIAKSYDIPILKPDILKSTLTYQIMNHTLLMPFTMIKNLGSEAARVIVLARTQKEFTDYFDFISRTYGTSVNKKTIENLINAGALEVFGNRSTLLYNLDAGINYASLTGGLMVESILKPTLEMQKENEIDQIEQENQSFGFYMSNHPSSLYQNVNIMKIKNIKSCYNKLVQTVVLIDRVKKITTKTGALMAFINASDETGKVSYVLFASFLKELESVKEHDLVAITGRVERRFDEYQINVTKIEKINKE